MNLFALFTRSA